MKCLNRIEMQLYIDNELSAEKSAEILDHLQNCKQCKNLYNETINEKQIVFDLLSQLDETNATSAIPEFKIPLKKHTNIRFQLLKIAAAVIIVFGLYFALHQKTSYNTIKMEPLNSVYESLDNSDLNKKWHKKQVEIIITDANGNIEESIISGK